MIKFIAIGRVKEKAMVSLIQEYNKRLKTIHKVELFELQKSVHKDSDIEKILEDESLRILSKIDDRDFVILLDLKGINLDSPGLAQQIDKGLNSGKHVVFVIGGSHGVNKNVKARANFMWQLSNLTFPHQLVRLLLYEQVYRSFMIIKNHPYHK